MDGTPFKIGEREFSVPRLRVAAYESAVLTIQETEKIPVSEDPFGLKRLNALCSAAVELLRENHPELRAEDVKALVHLDELDAVLSGLLQAGGKKKVSPGEVVSP